MFEWIEDVEKFLNTNLDSANELEELVNVIKELAERSRENMKLFDRIDRGTYD